MVFDSYGFAYAVHAPQGVAHVNGGDTQTGSRQRPQSLARRPVGAVDIDLAGNTRPSRKSGGNGPPYLPWRRSSILRSFLMAGPFVQDGGKGLVVKIG